MSKHFESAKAKLAEAKEHGTTAVLDTEEAAALYSIIDSMHLVSLSDNKEPTRTIGPNESKVEYGECHSGLMQYQNRT